MKSKWIKFAKGPDCFEDERRYVALSTYLNWTSSRAEPWVLPYGCQTSLQVLQKMIDASID